MQEIHLLPMCTNHIHPHNFTDYSIIKCDILTLRVVDVVHIHLNILQFCNVEQYLNQRRSRLNFPECQLIVPSCKNSSKLLMRLGYHKS